MSKIRLSGSNSGYVEIAAAADAGNLTFTMPTTGTALFGNGNNVISGITTFSAALDINSSIDVSGTSVFNNDVTFDGATAGYDAVWDRSDNALEFAANAKATFGAAQDMQLYHDGNHGYIADAGTGNLRLRSGTLEIQNLAGSKTSAIFSSGGGQTLNFNNNAKFVTTNTGAVVTGICTATSFSGSGAGLTGLVTPLSFRNLIVNGAMMVAQRGQVTGVTNGFGGPDRFRFQSNYSAVTMSQSTDVPSGQGFAKSLKLDVTTAGGISNADTYNQIDYRFEGQELTRLKYGSSGAETTILSFWIKSPKAGIHWVRLYGDELTSPAGGGNAFISRKYTVSSANTWQNVTLSFPGLTSDGFNNDNTTGMRISWYFAQGSAYSSGTAQADDGGWLNWNSASDRARNTVGQVNCFDSTSNDIFLTGVQFESASTATTFEHRSFGEELERCRRYYQVILDRSTDSGDDSGLGGTVYTGAGGGVYVPIRFCPPMRTKPTAESSSHSNGFRTRHGDLVNFTSFTGFNTWSRHGGTLITSGSGNKTIGHYYWIETDQGAAKLAVSAEL